MITTEIPPAFLDLINAPRVAALTTLMPNGQPQDVYKRQRRD